MPINKNAQLRYLRLDKCFRNFGRRYYLQDLLNEVNQALRDASGDRSGIQERQLRNDISFMKSEAGYSAPIVAYQDGRRVFYRYDDKKYSIRNNPLTTEESEKMKEAIFVLSRFRGLPQFEWVNEIIPMLNDKFGISNNNKEIILFESNVDYSGTEFIEQLFNAIKNSRVLKITYKDFISKSPYDIIFHPYILKQYNNRWFVFGKNEKKNLPNWNFALDRICNIEEMDFKYEENLMDWEDEYFYDIIGVSKGRNPSLEVLILEINKSLVPYIQTKPIHPTQKINKHLQNGNIIISIQVFPNYELETLILSFGEKIKIISPKSIRKIIKSRLETALSFYKE